MDFAPVLLTDTTIDHFGDVFKLASDWVSSLFTLLIYIIHIQFNSNLLGDWLILCHEAANTT